MPPLARERLRAALQGSECYLEYGSGGSTLLASEIGVARIVSVESDPDWLEAVARAGEGGPGERILLHADIGPTGEWGHPTSDAEWRRWRRYPLIGWEVCQSRNLAPDVVLIDGRFRVACLYAALLFARPGTCILFDDYLNRPRYHGVETILRPQAMHDRLAEFVRPQTLDRDTVWLALMEAVADQA